VPPVVFGRLVQLIRDPAAHTVPHELSAQMSVSQPFEGPPEQSKKPGSQVMLQVPDAQEPPLVFARSVQFRREPAAHTVPHEVSVQMAVSQPFEGPPEQSKKPPEQVTLQVPEAQVPPVVFGRSVQLIRPAHVVPQALFIQMLASQPVDDTLSQLSKPAMQAPRVHVPPGQVSAALARLHVTPQPPQSVRVVVERSHPSPALPLQSSKPPLHAVMVQVPVAHDSVAFVRLHAVPQPPQLVRELRAVSQPLLATVSQLPRPASQVPTAHVPEAQVSVPPASAHATPHPPQSVRVRVLRSQPLPSLPSQLSKPALQVP
jgi:hypothetical protein